MKAFAVQIPVPCRAAGFKQVECADDVCLDEIIGSQDGPVDVRLSGEVQNMCDRMTPEKVDHCRLVAQVDLLENIFSAIFDALQVSQISGVGQAIEIDQFLNFRSIDDVPNHVRPDKTSATCEQQRSEEHT